MSAPTVPCELSLQLPSAAGQPLLLRMRLRNGGKQALQLLRWQTPFEGRWSAEVLTLSRDGQALRYQGPQIKRAAPRAADYLTLAAGAEARAELDLSLPYGELGPGRYELQPRFRVLDWRLADQAGATAPSPALALDCPVMRFELPARR